MTIEHIKAKDFGYFIGILAFFQTDYTYYPVEHNYGFLGVYENSVNELNKLIENEPLKSELHILKKELLSAFDQHLDFWCWLNAVNSHDNCNDANKVYRQRNPEFGIQVLSMTIWDDDYPNSNMTHQFYHPEMLKLLTKKYIWDIVFPNEILPNYQQPTCGELVDFLPDNGFD